ncbi:MAG: hypothetical protein ACREID_06635 [Planctomycetota bacterium]
MRKLVLLLLAAGTAGAHQATEIYIPIGKSPGLSGKVTIIGSCAEVQAKERAVAIRAGGKSWNGLVTETTKIFLDRSKLRLPNTYGTFEDLRRGRMMEIKYRDGEGERACEWIKVQVAGEPASRR